MYRFDSTCPAGVVRHYDSFQALADEIGDSRIYIGFHFRSSIRDGAHPVTRSVPATTGAVDLRKVGALPGGISLQAQLDNLSNVTQPVVIEIRDSLVHPVDLSTLPGTFIDGGSSLRLAQSLTIRAIEGERPIILLAQPLAFRPVTASAATADFPVVRLEGLFLARDPAAPAGRPIRPQRAAGRRLDR